MVKRSLRLFNPSRITLCAVILAFAGWVPFAVAGANAWTSSGPTTSVIQALIADPTGESSVYCGAVGPVLFNLKADHWEKVSDGTGSAYANLNAVSVDPGDPRTILVGVSSSVLPPKGGIYKSTDRGRTWVFIDVHDGDPVFSVSIDPLAGGTAYVVASVCSCLPRGCLTGLACSGRVYKSTDSGLTWTRQGNLDGVTALAIDPVASSRLYAVALGGVFKSDDGGATWIPMNSGFSDSCGPSRGLAISRNDPSVLYVTTKPFCAAAVYKTTDGGSIWRPTGLTFEHVGVTDSIAVDPTNENIVYLTAGDAGVFRGGAGFFRSTDGGENWTRFDAGLPDPNTDLVAVDRDGATVHVSIFQKGVFDYSYVPPLRPPVQRIGRSPTVVPVPSRQGR